MPGGMLDVEAVARAVGDAHARAGAVQPERPDGHLRSRGALGDLVARLPDHVHVLLDESYVQFQDVEPEDSCMSLVEAFPRLVVVRSFSQDLRPVRDPRGLCGRLAERDRRCWRRSLRRWA